jgi:site-specific DNA recombinase
MRFLLYARKSTESEDRQVQSIEDQIRLAYEEAAKHGFQITRVISESRSAKAHGKREEFTKMLKAIEKGEADGIMAWHPDRLARNAVDGAMIIDALDRKKLVTLHFISYTFENSPEGKFMLGMIFSQSKYYVDKLSKDVLRGLKSKIDKGWYPHQAPEGYCNDKENHTIIVDPERFALLRRAWDLMLTGAYTGTQARTALNNWGYRTRKRGKKDQDQEAAKKGSKPDHIPRKTGDKPIAISGMYRMFDNPFYYGYFRHNGVLYKGAHPPMVTEAEFLRVQTILGRKQHIQPKTREFAFTGMIHCKHCGCLITAETKTKYYKGTNRTVSYTYYHCTNARKNCTKRSVSEAFLEDQMTKMLEEIRIDPRFCEWALAQLERMDNEEKARDESDELGVKQLERHLHDLEKKHDGLFEMRMSGEITSADFENYRTKLFVEIETAQAQLRALAVQKHSEQEAIQRALNTAKNAYERFTGGDIKAKREVALAIADKYFLTLDSLEIRVNHIVSKIATIEPLKIGSGKEKTASCEPDFSMWQGYVENIRTLVHQQGVYIEKEDRKLPLRNEG